MVGQVAVLGGLEAALEAHHVAAEQADAELVFGLLAANGALLIEVLLVQRQIIIRNRMQLVHHLLRQIIRHQLLQPPPLFHDHQRFWHLFQPLLEHHQIVLNEHFHWRNLENR